MASYLFNSKNLSPQPEIKPQLQSPLTSQILLSINPAGITHPFPSCCSCKKIWVLTDINLLIEMVQVWVIVMMIIYIKFS